MDDTSTQTQDGAHYVCKECGGTSNNPKSCDTEGCSMNGQPLAECTCEDGKHGKEDEDSE